MAQEIEQLVKDKQGRQYQMKGDYDDETGLLVVKLRYQNQEVGRTQCILYPSGEMKIGDLIIFDDVVHTPKNLRQWLKQKVSKPKPENYRNNGLGTHLLKFALDFAHLKGVKHVHGVLTQNDINTTPGLANWYRKYGFQLNPPAPEDPPATVHRISRWL
jgi:GNAT superfamily N-acetyltransferase